VSYNQLFQSGTTFNVQFSTNRSSTNSTFATFNPSYFSGATFTLTQPLVRGRGLMVNRAPIVIAQRNINQSRAVFLAQLNDSILTVINQYWTLVQAQKSLGVAQESLRLAEESYKRDKRALELGALPPLDIYRSESTVAQRKLQVIQAEYALKPLEDQFRRTIGADLDDRTAALDLILTEAAQPAGELLNQDIASALQIALQNRPELEAISQQLANDDTNVMVAGNNLKPDLSLSGFYTSNGRGGVQIDNSGNVPLVVSRGGFLDSLGQLGSFNFPTYGVSLDLRLPLRNRAASADLGAAMLTKRNDLYVDRRQRQAIDQEVRNAVHQLEESKLTLSAAATNRDLARKSLAAEERKYQLGAETVFFVLDAQNVLAGAEQSYVQAQIDYQRAVAALDHATGNLLSRNKVLVSDLTQ
jgi:outer membrane protein